MLTLATAKGKLTPDTEDSLQCPEVNMEFTYLVTGTQLELEHHFIPSVEV